MNNQEYAERFGRWIEPTEVVVEFDYPCPDYIIAIHTTLNNLILDGINVEMWRAWGMKCPHLHIKNIRGLEKLNDLVRTKYKELFIKKYVAPEFMQYADYSLCGKHKIAEENKPHFKYHYKKILLQHCNKDVTNVIQEHLVKRAEMEVMKEAIEKRHFNSEANRPGESIISVAFEYGLLPEKNGTEWRLLCPFHNDSEPSLFLNEEKGVFYCFGCDKGGNVASFKELLEQRSKG